MKLARVIRRVAREIVREARRNPDFAARLEAALGERAAAGASEDSAVPAPAPINPLALVQREGAGALEAALRQPGWDRAALLGLAEEHNLDPAGEAVRLEGEALLAHLVAQASRRVERDRRLFDY